MSRRPHTTAYAALLAAVLAPVLALALGAAPGDAAARRATAGSLALSDAVVAPSAKVTLSGALPPKQARTVKLQRRSGTSWLDVASRKSTSTGRFSFATTAPTSGTRTFRVLAPAATLGGRRYAAVVTPSRTLTVVRIVDVTAGWRHACAVGSNGAAWCWGDNSFGALGDGKGGAAPATQVSRPVRVVGAGWTALSAVGGNTCGRRSNGSAWCWGDAAQELVGQPKAPAPVQVLGQWRQVAVGWSYACGVHTDGTGWCWGRDESGQLGSADPVASGTPFNVPGTWSMIVPGSHQGASSTCGVRTDHTLWCWGDNSAGKLGDDDTTASRVPVQVAGVHQWTSVSVGYSHACGLDTEGTGWCWGDNTPGQVGDGTAINERHTPVQVTVATRWKRLEAGFQHSCGVTTSGAGWCWGWNDNGQLGDGTAETRYFPDPKAQQLAGTWADLTAGHTFSVGASAGTARSWGASGVGQTGHGQESADRLTPRLVAINP